MTTATPSPFEVEADPAAVGSVTLYRRENRKGARWKRVGVYPTMRDAVAAMAGMPGPDFWFSTRSNDEVEA